MNNPQTPTIKTGGIAIQAAANVLFTGPVAAFTAPSAAGVTQTATISWGDGTHSTATVTANGNQLTVTATHTYRKAGKYKVLVQVKQKGTGSKLAKLAGVDQDQCGGLVTKAE